MRVFPTVSETFVILNIVEAIKAGFQVKIIPDILDNKTAASQPHLIQQYNLDKKLYSFFSPSKRTSRYKKAIAYLLNPQFCYYFIRYCWLQKEVSLHYLFIIQFYNQFKKNTVFHVHFANREKPLFDLLKIGFLKSKIIITAHGFDIHNLSKEKALEINKWVSKITVNTTYLKTKSIDKGIQPNLIQVIPIGVDTSLFVLDTQEFSIKKNIDKTISLISVGRLTPLKGHIYGLKAVKLLVDKGYNITYTIIGEGQEKQSLKEYISKHDLQDTVSLKPFQEQRKLKKQLQESDIFLFPSTSDTTGRRETFGVVSLEAQSMGLPVIGFKSGGFPETLKEGVTGFTVTDRNVTEMAEKVQHLIDNPKVYTAMSEAAIEQAASFDHQYTTQKYIELYKKFM